jgi:hypothetical protein
VGDRQQEQPQRLQELPEKDLAAHPCRCLDAEKLDQSPARTAARDPLVADPSPARREKGEQLNAEVVHTYQRPSDATRSHEPIGVSAAVVLLARVPVIVAREPLA